MPPRLQIVTVGDLLGGKKIDYPLSRGNVTFKKVPKATAGRATTMALPLGLPDNKTTDQPS